MEEIFTYFSREGATQEELSEIVRMLDADRNTNVTLQELIQFTKDFQAAPQSLCLSEDEKIAKINVVFELYDDDYDGLLSVDELTRFVNTLYESELSAAELEVQVEQLIINLDTDGDFMISREELINSLR